jgi:hypothetical protein
MLMNASLPRLRRDSPGRKICCCPHILTTKFVHYMFYAQGAPAHRPVFDRFSPFAPAIAGAIYVDWASGWAGER